MMIRDSSIFDGVVSIPPWVYIEIPYTGGKLICDRIEIAKQGKMKVPDSYYQLQNELNNLELLMLKANGTNDKEITPLLNSLKWIRRAWDADDYDDKVIYSIIALEFVVSKESNSPMMDKTIRKKCKGEIRKIIAKMDQLPMDRIQYSQQVCDKFDRAFTETPFMLKLRRLIDRLNIPVSAEEMSLIVECRNQRNGIVHGNSESKITKERIYKLCECIGRITLYKIKSLGD